MKSLILALPVAAPTLTSTASAEWASPEAQAAAVKAAKPVIESLATETTEKAEA
jgi:hypothetical protein